MATHAPGGSRSPPPGSELTARALADVEATDEAYFGDGRDAVVEALSALPAPAPR